MLRIAILTLGLVLGYLYGYRDAQRNDKSIPSRIVDSLADGVRTFTDSDAAGGGHVSKR